MSIAASEQSLYDEFDELVGDEKDPVVIEALKRVWLIWDKKAVPWMRPTWHTCSKCNMPAFCIDSVVEMSWTCAKCFYEQVVKERREEERARCCHEIPLNLEDFVRV